MVKFSEFAINSGGSLGLCGLGPTKNRKGIISDKIRTSITSGTWLIGLIVVTILAFVNLVSQRVTNLTQLPYYRIFAAWSYRGGQTAVNL